jgi:hypothetical protein
VDRRVDGEEEEMRSKWVRSKDGEGCEAGLTRVERMEER